MNFLTHITISGALYRHFAKEQGLNRWGFLYGNIKPDLSSKCLQNPHVLDNYFFMVCSQTNQLVSQGASPKELSVELGIICHFICDFFCYYHLNSKLHKSFLDHFIYELRLHMVLHLMLHQKKIKLKPSRKNPRKSIGSIVMEMRKEYHTKHITCKRDIEYAFLASIWACESIFYL
ncbi:MAG: zinc dependent phospholipase C family protein, partial [Bacillota bacterium]